MFDRFGFVDCRFDRGWDLGTRLFVDGITLFSHPCLSRCQIGKEICYLHSVSEYNARAGCRLQSS
jgi:hypothetical protein